MRSGRDEVMRDDRHQRPASAQAPVCPDDQVIALFACKLLANLHDKSSGSSLPALMVGPIVPGGLLHVCGVRKHTPVSVRLTRHAHVLYCCSLS